MPEPLFEPVELDEADRRVDVRQLEVEPEDGMGVRTAGPARRAALVLELADSGCNLGVVGHDDSPCPVVTIFVGANENAAA